jgi:CheY-like chemotaxis protein
MPPKHVLVCAEPSTAELVADVLRSRGYTAETAHDGALALELADRTRPDVVVAWSDLPGPGGPDLILGVRMGSPATLMAEVLGPADTGQAPALLEAGADALLLDDGDLELLAWAVDQVVAGGLVVAPALARALVTGGAVGVLAGPNGAVLEAAAVEPPLAPQEPVRYQPGVDFTTCDVAEIVQEAAAEAGQGCPNLLVQVSTPPRLPTVGVPHALAAVVRILVEMACADSEPGSDVVVKAQRGDAGITVYFTDRGPGLDRKQVAAAMGAEGPADRGPTHRLNVARGLVAVHGGILWAEPLPAGGQRVSFTIPEQPPVLTGVELKGAMRALELLEELENPPAPEPPGEPDAEAPRDDALDLTAAVADAAALAQEPAPAPAEPEVEVDEPATSLAELFDMDPLAAGLDEVVTAPEPAAPAEEEELIAFLEPEEEEELVAFLEPEPEEEEAPLVSEPEPEAEIEVAVIPEPEPVAEDEELVAPAQPDLEAEEEDILAAALAEPEVVPEPEAAPKPEPPVVEPVSLPEPVPVLEPPAADVLDDEISEPEPVPVVPEPVPATAAAAEATERSAGGRALPAKKFIADPLHPATAILRSLAEDYDDKRDGRPGF